MDDKKLFQSTFIGNWYLKNNDLCSQLINFYQKNEKSSFIGRTHNGINLDAKKCRQITVFPKQLTNPDYAIFVAYFSELNEFLRDLRVLNTVTEKTLGKLYIGPFNLQKYEPGGHFNAMHCERHGMSTATRALAFMTYLNNCDDGFTYFDHFDKKIKPSEGLTLVWPSDWTHAHCGLHVSSEKYIITGWLEQL
jgi:prolyl 4-hydroxylase